MTNHDLAEFLRQLARTQLNDGRSDGALLADFAADRNEDAFLALVGRHTLTVWSICRNALTNPSDAEDAFQATFMALAAKADELKGREQVEAWLRVTARFATRQLNRDATRRDRRLQAAGELTFAAATGTEAVDWTAVQEEFAALPEEHRRALSLYYLEGRTYAEVGERLGCSLATAQRRVLRAAEMLRGRLRSRGITSVAGGILGGIFVADTALAQAPSADLIRETVRLARGTAGGVVPPVPAGALAAELIARKSLMGVRAAGAAVAVVLLAGVVVGAVSFAQRAAPPAGAPNPPRVAAAPAAQPILPGPKVAPLTVLEGVARDEVGRPVPGARVTALAYFARYGQGGIRDEALASTVADTEGKFKLSVPDFPTAVTETRRVKLLATAPSGKATTQTVLLPDPGASQAVDVRLESPCALRGVVVDSGGEPVPDAVVRLTGAAEVSVVPLAGEAESNIPGWPAPVRTDANGRFELAGVPSRKLASVAVEHAELAYQQFVVEAPRGAAPELRLQLGKVRVVTGRVTAEDTNAPVAGALISAVSVGPGDSVYGRNIRVGADGTFRFSAPAGRRITLRVHPPQGAALLAIAHDFEWPQDAKTKLWEPVLPRGVPVRGRVTEAGTGQPIPGAQVSFNPTDRAVNKANGDAGHVLVGASALVVTDKDGKFEFPVPPRKGTLDVDAPSLVYRSVVTDSVVRSFDGVTRAVRSPHATEPLDVSDGKALTELAVTLHRGEKLVGRAVLPDGSPVKLGGVLCRHLTNPRDLIRPVALPIRDGTFEVPGCQPDYEYSVLLVTSDFKHGAVARLKCSKSGAGVVTTTLRPSGWCSVEMTSPTGAPEAGVAVSLTLTLDSESPAGKKPVGSATQVPYSHAFVELRSLFPKLGPSDWIATDQEGTARFAGLIPDATHHVWLPGPKGQLLGVELRVPPGEEKRVSAKKIWTDPK